MNNIVKLFEGTETLTSDTELLFTISTPDESHNEAQGGCSDGTYYYQTFMHRDRESNEANNTCFIAKIDIKTGKVVKWSSEYNTLNHCNDIVYNPKRNLLVLCHNNPNRERLTLIDPETLDSIDTVELSVKIYSIDYSPKRDMYVVGLSGGQDLMFLDSDFNPVDEKAYPATEKTKRYVTQGICSDEELIYCVLWDARARNSDDFQGVITVYDWEGSYVGIIEFDIGVVEPENVCIIDGELYMIASKQGASFYKIEPKVQK